MITYTNTLELRNLKIRFDANGTAAIKLKHDQSITIKVPYSTDYVIVEKANNYKTEVTIESKAISGKTVEGTLTDNVI